jgi:hypothetical protein
VTAAAHLRLLSDAPPPGEEERPEARLGLEEELRLGLAARSWRRSSRCTFGIAASKNSGVGAVRGRGMVWSCLLEPYRVNTKTLTVPGYDLRRPTVYSTDTVCTRPATLSNFHSS